MANTLEVAINSDGAKSGATQFNRATASMGRHADKLDRKVDRLDSGMLGLGSTVKGAGKLIGGLFAGVGALGAIRGAVSAIAKFEETMATVRGVTGATHEEFVQLSAQAKILGANTRFSATQAGEGLLFLARAGFTVDQSLAAIEPSLKFAQANVIELGQAADIVSNIMTQFGLAAEETSRATDVLTLTANSANTNILQLSEGMKFVGPVAGALGRTIEETSAAIGVLGNSGIQASLAGTGLRAIMLALVAPTTQAEEAVTGLGLTMDELNPIVHSLTDIFKKLRDAEIGAEEANAIFGRRAVGSALQLAKNVEQLEELEEALKHSEGTVKDLADLMDDTLVGAAKNVTSAFEAVALQTGDQGVLGGLKSLLNAIADAVRLMIGMKSNLDEVSEGAKNLAFALQLIGAALAIIVAQKAALVFGIIAQKIALATMGASGLSVALLGVVATLASIKLGSWAFDEFRVVQEYALKTIVLIGEQFQQLKFIFKTVISVITTTFGGLFNFIIDGFIKVVSKVGGLVKNIEGLVSKLPFVDIEGAGDKIQAFAERSSKFKFDTDLTAQLAEITSDRDASLLLLAEIEKQGLADIAAEFGKSSRKGVSLMQSVSEDFKTVRDLFLKSFSTEDPNLLNLTEGAEKFQNAVPLVQAQVDQLTGAFKLLDDISQDAGRTMAMAFEDVVVGAKSASDAIKALAQDIARLVVRQAVTEPLSAAISSGLSSFAQGGKAPYTPLEQFSITAQGSMTSPVPGALPNFAAQAPTINIVNNSSGDIETSGIDFDPREFVVSVVVDDVRHGGPIRGVLGEQ